MDLISTKTLLKPKSVQVNQGPIEQDQYGLGEGTMVNPHTGTSKALLKSIQNDGWTPSKGWLLHGATKRANRHRSSARDKGRGGM